MRSHTQSGLINGAQRLLAPFFSVGSRQTKIRSQLVNGPRERAHYSGRDGVDGGGGENDAERTTYNTVCLCLSPSLCVSPTRFINGRDGGGGGFMGLET